MGRRGSCSQLPPGGRAGADPAGLRSHLYTSDGIAVEGSDLEPDKTHGVPQSRYLQHAVKGGAGVSDLTGIRTADQISRLALSHLMWNNSPPHSSQTEMIQSQSLYYIELDTDCCEE